MNEKDCAYLVYNYIIGQSWVYGTPKSYTMRNRVRDLQSQLAEDVDAREMLGLIMEYDRMVIRRAFIKAVKPVLLFKKWKNGCRVRVLDRYGQTYLLTEDPVKYAKLAIAHGIPATIGNYRVQLRCSMPWVSPDRAEMFFSTFTSRYRNEHKGKYMKMDFVPRLDLVGPDTVDP